jgi:multidrug efflux pump subunit AcrA (membrane-fusion protein)
MPSHVSVLPPPSIKRTAVRIAIVPILALGAGDLSGCHASHAQGAATAAAAEALVRVTHPVETTAGMSEYTGTVHSRIESELGFRVPGKITARLVDPGMLVHRGQPLMRLDPANLALNAAAAKQRLIAANADATRAAAEEERQSGLLAQGAISQTSYEAARAACDASAAVRTAAEAASHDAQLNLEYATLIADSDGIVVDVLAQPGQVVAPGTPIAHLAESGPREVLVAIPETAVADLPREGVAQVYGTHRSTFAARFSLQGDGSRAPLGATITLRLGAARGMLTAVPLAALHDGGQGMGVWVVTKSSQVAFRPVTVTALGQETATLAAGTLTPDDVVVALGAHLLRAGETVRILKDPS